MLTLLKGKKSYYETPKDAPQWEPVSFYSKVAIAVMIFIGILALILDILAVTGGFGKHISSPAVAMMCVACVGLWGGIAVSLTITMRRNKEKKMMAGEEETLLQDYEDAELVPPDRDDK